MTHPHHHMSIRKRVHAKKQKYPHPDKRIAFFDRFIIALGVFNVIATLPQLFQIWLTHDATGVSLETWSYYTFFSTMLLAYGVIHKEMPIIVNYGAVFLVYLGIAIGAALY